MRLWKESSEACQLLERRYYLKKIGMKMIDLLRKEEHLLRYGPVFKNMVFNYTLYRASDCDWESFKVVEFWIILLSKFQVLSYVISVYTIFLGFSCFFGRHDLNQNLYNVFAFILQTLQCGRFSNRFSKTLETLK